VGGVLNGFAVVGGIVLVGYLLGRLHILPDTGRDVLARLAFFVASPALLFQLLSGAELHEIFSPVLWVTVMATAISALTFIAIGALRHWGVAKTALGSMCASYVNAGNLGLPLAGMAVPSLLLAYGISLYGSVVPGRGEDGSLLVASMALKLVVQPVAAWLLGEFAFGLHGQDLLAVVFIAALPTAQNIFIYAVRFRTGEVLARDAILVSTTAAPFLLMGVAALFG